MKSAVLFLIFKKVEQTKKVFDSIRAAKPPKLYIAADAARPNINGEEELCIETRKIINLVDWPCELHTRIRDTNTGITEGITSAIDWFFEHEEEGIILEDDTLPQETFWPFMDDMLDRYRHDDRVFCVSGCNLNMVPDTVPYSYIFYSYIIVWGWGNWRRNWVKHQAIWKMHDEVLASGSTLDAHTIDRYENSTLRRTIKQLDTGKLDSWDYCFELTMLKHGGLVIIPSKNLIINIGFDPNNATHTTNSDHPFAQLKSESLSWPLNHPKYIYRSRTAEDNFFYKGQNLHLYLSFSELRIILFNKLKYQLFSKIWKKLRESF
jgi:hypothetical protein